MSYSNQRLGAELFDIVRRDRARRTRGERFGKAIGKLFVALLTGFVTALSGGWAFMLAVGVIHAEWLPQVPTIGYWWAVLIAWLLRWALNHTESSAKKDGDR